MLELRESTLTDNLHLVIKDQDLNVISAYVAAQQATLGFAELPDNASKTFIYTGNYLNEKVILPRFHNSAIGKAAAARFIHFAAEAYAEQGFKYVCSFFDFDRTAADEMQVLFRG